MTIENAVEILIERYKAKVLQHEQKQGRYVISLNDNRSIHVIEYDSEIYVVMYKHLMTVNMSKHDIEILGLVDDAFAGLHE